MRGVPQLPEPEWFPLADAKKRAASAFPDDDPREVEAAVVQAFNEGKIRTKGRCRSWYEHDTVVHIEEHVWDTSRVIVEWERNRFGIFDDPSLARTACVHTFTDVDANRKDFEEWCRPAMAPQSTVAEANLPLINERSVWDWAEKIASEYGEKFGLVLGEIAAAVERGDLPATVPNAPNDGWRLLLPPIVEAVRIATAIGELPRHEGIWTQTHRIVIGASEIENWLSDRVTERSC